MIPRLKPQLGLKEIAAVLRPSKNAVSKFEQGFANAFDIKNAIAFPYGRSALWALFKALKIEGYEIVQPAYTCVVVAHATVLSGNLPRFVDIEPNGFNMDLDLLESAITEKTRAVVATHLFGYPMDIEKVAAIVTMKERQYGNKIYIVQDCAHSFGAEWKGREVHKVADAALFGLNISKTITSVFGGVLSTDNGEIAEKVRTFRDKEFKKASQLKGISRFGYLMAAYGIFSKPMYSMVNWLERNTSLLDQQTKAYHLDEKIHFPPDYDELMLGLEAKVGLSQVERYPGIIAAHRENAAFYNERLDGCPGIQLPPIVEGATYSHFVIRVKNRAGLLDYALKRGVQLGQLIEYCVPEMDSYREYAADEKFANASVSSQGTVNLPVYPSLSNKDREKVAIVVLDYCKGMVD